MSTKVKNTGRPTVPVTWRDGIHISGTSIWCDAVRARDICFLSVASAMRGAKHAQLIASRETLMLLGVDQKRPVASQLSVPFGQPFTLGESRIELFSSGHALGSASLLVNLPERKVLYAGDVNPRGSAAGGAIDHRSADILVLSARYGQRQFEFPEPTSELNRLARRCLEICEGGGIAVLLVGDVGKALDLRMALPGMPKPMRAHSSIVEASKRIFPDSPGGPNNRANKALGGYRGRGGGFVLLWPTRTRSKLERAGLPPGSATFLVSGRALEGKHLRAAGADEGIALSNRADHRELVHYIQSSGARDVYVTHSCDRGRDLADALPAHRIRAIGPPEQLNLF